MHTHDRKPCSNDLTTRRLNVLDEIVMLLKKKKTNEQKNHENIDWKANELNVFINTFFFLFLDRFDTAIVQIIPIKHLNCYKYIRSLTSKNLEKRECTHNSMRYSIYDKSISGICKNANIFSEMLSIKCVLVCFASI